MLILFFALWLILSGKITVGVCVSGAAAAAVLYWFGRKVLGYDLHTELVSLKKLWLSVRYLGYLLAEMLKAGFVVMKLIYTKGRNMEPELIYFENGLKSDGMRAILANSITLTAGTITVQLEGKRLCVHTLDKSLAVGLEDSEFQRRLRKLEE